jgi:DNA-binding winged helix-turn-helix (wHTH) protein
VQFKFEQFIIDGDRRVVARAGEEVHVAPKTLDFLLTLLGRAPNAVSKAELMTVLWPDTHVSDATLTGVVADAREALGDDGRAARLIRTVHRFGYAFTGTLEREAAPGTSEPVLGWLIADSWRLPLRSGETILGREGEGVVPLPSPSVSRQHAALIIEGTAARLRDLGSKNGTFVDEIRVEGPTALRDGASVRLGTLTLIYRSVDRTSTTDTI